MKVVSGLLAVSLMFPPAFVEAGLLDLPDASFRTEIVSSRARPGRIEYDVRFPSPVKSPFEANDTVWGHLWIPKGKGPFPAVLVLPVMAAPNVWIETRFMNRFVRAGLAVFWIEMPYQFHRRPHPSIPSGQVFLARTPERLAANFRQSVLDARRALTWLEKHPSIDPGRIGLFGISLGSMVSATVYSVDPRPRYAVFLLGGADFPSLLFGSSMTSPFLRRAGLELGAIREAFKGIDPLDYTEANASKKALLINARWDSVIPRPNALMLHKAFPASRQVWIPFGHYTATLHLFWVTFYAADAFRENL